MFLPGGTMTLQEYEDAVSTEMKGRYGLTWQDASGDAEPVTAALRNGKSPEEFVAWWGGR
jgi:hypothetical protein